MADIGGFRLFIQGLSTLPCATQPFSFEALRGAVIDSLGLDASGPDSDRLRLDSLRFEHFSTTSVRTCSDADLLFL